ncbi:hypothetical protein, partial [Bacillus sp. JJ1764]|uniref:hypothetical protein n=1 Tax=Bacillus sp. JJ1764 TaxID=3122964 RepID=UPI002FFE88FD
GDRGMRTWRVGTFSMGGALVLLGLFLFLSRFFGFDLIQAMTAWWPVLLIVLGIEILLYLFLSRQEKPILKYDFLSIVFVGIIGMVGIAFAVLNTTGLTGKIEEVMVREERSFELPDFTYQVNADIKRVVVRTTGYDMTIESSPENAVSMFGTYRVQTADNTKLIKRPDDYISANQKGDTLYINVKSLPNEVAPFNQEGEMAATILVPNNIKVEVIGSDNTLRLKPRMLTSNWNIESASSIVLDTSESKDLKIAAVGVQEVTGKDGEWKVTEKPATGEGEPSLKSAIFQSGEGKYTINIANAYQVSLNSGQ